MRRCEADWNLVFVAAALGAGQRIRSKDSMIDRQAHVPYQLLRRPASLPPPHTLFQGGVGTETKNNLSVASGGLPEILFAELNSSAQDSVPPSKTV